MRLTGDDVRELRKAHRCPDCTAEVRVNRRTGQVDVHHDDTCPTLGKLRRNGGHSGLIFMRRPGQSDADFLATVTAAAANLAASTGKTYQLRTDPYDGAPVTTVKPLSSTESQDPGTPRGRGRAKPAQRHPDARRKRRR